MKKISIVSTLILALGVVFTSCGGDKSAKNVELRTGIDSLSYAIGVQNAAQMRQFLPAMRGLDLENMDDFVRGFLNEMYAPEEDTETNNYTIGRQVAAELRMTLAEGPLFPDDPTSYPNKDAFVDGIVNTLLEKARSKMTPEDAIEFIQYFIDRRERANNLPAIEAEAIFLETNAQREGVITTESGLQYRIIVAGSGEVPGEGRTVVVHYTGTLLDGTVFDCSVSRGIPFEFNTSEGVIEAWLEATRMMPVGSKWVVYAPSALAYGSHNMGIIPPFSTLIFEIEMLAIAD